MCVQIRQLQKRWFQTLVAGLALLPLQSMASEWRLSVGGVYALSDSTFTADDIGQGRGVDIDFERDLALEDESFLPKVDLEYHFAGQHSVSLSYFRLHRSGSNERRSQPFEVNWIDDTTYQVEADAAISTTFDYEIYRLYYSYDFLSSKRHQFGVSAGLHVVPVSFELDGEITACANDGQQQVCDSASNQVINDSITAPLPNFGVFGTWGFAPQWELSARLQYFYLEVDTFEGGLLDVSALVRYGITDNWYVGAGYGYYDLRAIDDGDRADLELEVVYQGAQLLAEYRF